MLQSPGSVLKSLDLPGLVPVQKCREDAMKVCAGADEEEDDEKEGLELEDAELGNLLSLHPMLHSGGFAVP